MIDLDENGYRQNVWPVLSAPLPTPKLRTLSLGVGVQSVTLALMAARREIGPMPDVAIFADTSGERASTYKYLDWLETVLPFPVHRVRRPGPTLAELSIGVANGTIDRVGTGVPPWFYRDGMMRKQCSGAFKRDVVLAEIRRMVGLAPRQRAPKGDPFVETWLGMSTDEMQRVATSRQPWIHNRHPLVEAGMRRSDCITWLEERQYPIPDKSACVFCPYRRNDGWRHMRDNAPEDFAEACRVDELIRDGVPGLPLKAFIHRSCVPLAQADLGDDDTQTPLPFMADCEACGL